MTVEELEIIVSAKIEQVKPQIQKVVKEIKNAVKDTDGLGTELLGKFDTAKLTRDINQVKKKTKEIFDPNDTSGMKINGQNIIKGVNQSIQSLKGRKIDLGNAIEINNYQNKLSQLRSTAQETKEVVSKVGAVKYNTAEIQKVVDSYKRINNIKADSGGTSKLKDNLKSSDTHGKKLSNTVQQVKKHLSGAGNGAKLINSGLSKAKSMASNVTAHLKVGLGQILKIAGSLIGLRAIYSGLRSVASSWLSSQNVQAQQLNTNIEYMKYALGSSLQPVIETIVNLIYQALKGVQSLIYALTGVNIFANASAKAYASMAKSANNASKATESLNLSDIDEIHNIQEDTSSSGGSGGGTLPNFDLSGIETANWLQKLLDNVKNGNWYEIGATVGTKINDTLKKIPWNEIKETAGNIGKNLGQFINGGVKTTNWELVGGTVAEGVNTVFSFLKNFLETTDFRSLGEAVSRTINGFFDTVDWDVVGQTLSAGVEGALDFMIGAIDTFDSSKVEDAVGRIFTNINWSEIWDKMLELLVYGALKMTGIPRFVKLVTGIASGIKTAIETVKNKFTENGGNIAQGILEGILDGLVNIATWIDKHILTPFIDGFKKAFGIHSPSKVMAEMGGYIIEGLKNGIVNAKSMIDEALLKVKLWFAKSAEGIANLFIGALNRVIDMINSVSFDLPDWLGGGHFGFDLSRFDEINLTDEIEKDLQKFEKTAEKIGQNTAANYNKGLNSQQGTTTSIMNKLKQKISDGINNASQAYNAGYSTGNSHNSGLNSQSGTLAWVLNSWKDKIRTALNNSSSAYIWGADMMEGFNNGIDAKKQKIIDAVRGMADSIKRLIHFSRPDEGPLRDYETWMPDMIDGLSNSLLNSAPKLTNAVAQVSSSIADNMRATDLGVDVNSNINKTINSNILGSQLENAVYSAIQKAENLFRLTINNELKLNSKTIAQEILDDLNNEAKRRGYRPILEH